MFACEGAKLSPKPCVIRLPPDGSFCHVCHRSRVLYSLTVDDGDDDDDDVAVNLNH